MKKNCPKNIASLTASDVPIAQQVRSAGAMLFSIIAFAAAVSLAGCGGGSSTPPTPPLEITSAALPAGTMNSAYGGGSGFALAASGGVAPYKWSWAPAAGSTTPPGLSLSNGLISGSPTTQGLYNVVVTVSDSESPAAQINIPYSITINDQNQALAITSFPPPTGIVGTSYDDAPVICVQGSPECVCTFGGNRPACRRKGFLMIAVGGVSPYTWSWTAVAGSSLPPGLSISSGGVIFGYPTKDGSFHVVVAVTDSSPTVAQASASYTLVIAPPPPPVITTTVAPAFTLGVLYPGFPFVATGGTPPYTWSEGGTLPTGMTFSNTAGVLSGTPTATGPFLITVTLEDSAGQSAVSKDFRIQVFSKGFSPSAIMSMGRVWHTATLLENGKVLVTGGVSDTTFPTAAELFDPLTASFAPAGNMDAVRVSATATLLDNGLVLVAGGKKTDGSPIETAELFDPNLKSFKPTGSMDTERVYHASTLLNDGKVLVTGGLNLNGGLSGIPVATGEEFDPTTGIFAPTDNLGLPRFFHTSTLLGNGKVLITGGLKADGSATATAELFDPSSRSFTTVANMSAPRAGHAATLLKNGQVLITGGAASFGGNASASAELFDPVTDSFIQVAGMSTGRSSHTSTLMTDGRVLVVGGDTSFYNGAQAQSLSEAEIFDPSTETFTVTTNMTTARESHTATLLNTGDVLVVGGSNGLIGYSDAATTLDTAELYQ